VLAQRPEDGRHPGRVYLSTFATFATFATFTTFERSEKRKKGETQKTQKLRKKHNRSIVISFALFVFCFARFVFPCWPAGL
jgi:hypothetical protein